MANEDPTRDPGYRDSLSDPRHTDGTHEVSYGYQPDSPYDESGSSYDDGTSGAPGDPSSRIRHSANPASHHKPGGLNAKDLKNKEESGGASKGKQLAAGGLAGLAGAEGKGNGGGGDSPFNYVNNGARFGGARSFLQKHRKKVIASSLAGVGILPMLALLLFLLGALKIPHFVENVAAWRFAKITRQYRQSMSNVMNEKNAFDALSDEDKVKAKAKYGRFEAFDKVNRLRPNKVLQSLHASDRIQYNYKTTLTGKQKLTSITLAPDDARTKVEVKVPSGTFDKLIHPFRTVDRYKTISDALNSAMKAHDPKIPALTRALATRLVLQKAGASLKGMAAAKYIGKSDLDAKIQIEREAFEKAHRDGAIGGLKSDNMKEAAQEADDAEKAAVADNDQMKDLVNKGQDIPDSVNQAVERSLNPNNLKSIVDTAVKFINPIYDIAVPVCMAYDGSKITSEAVDAHHDAVVSEAAYVMSTGDQQKNGNAFNSPAANAMNWKLGDVQQSNAIRRVSGKPVDTTAGLGGQRTTLGTYGEYTIFDVFHLGVLNESADKLCPVLSNFWVGVGLGVVNLGIQAVIAIFSGGTVTAGEEAAVQGARVAAEKALTTVVKDFIKTAAKKSIKTFATGGRFAKQFAKDTIKYGAAAAAATFLATLIVHNAAGNMTSGLEHSVAFDDNVDEGADQMSCDISRANYYGRFLNNEEAPQSHAADQNEIAYNNEHQSAFNRYLALENPNSLASRMVITTGSLLNRSTFAGALNSLANIFNPIGLSSKLFASANAQTTFAAPSQNTQDYGNMQCGYSNVELNLMKQDTYASPSENAYALDQSGMENDINNDYSECFTLSIGQLLEEHKVKRNEQGDVLNDGDCSPQNLGPENPKYKDNVFRWRLKHMYASTTDTLLGIQDPSANSGGTTSGNVGDIPSGTAQQLAQQILSSANISFQLPEEKTAMQHIADTGHASTCGSPATSAKLLGIILAMSKKYKIVVGVLTDGHECSHGSYHTYHSDGMAADLNGVNPLDGGSGGTGRFITAADYHSNALLRQFYGDMGNTIGSAGGGGMGQIQCFNTPPAKNAKVGYFPDTCNHLHIDVGTH